MPPEGGLGVRLGHVPELVAREPQLSDAGVQLITALLDNGPDSHGMHGLLSSAGTLVTGADARSVMRVFEIDATPTYHLIGPDGTVTAHSANLAGIPLPLPTN
ncbi:hypothetical protein [Streptomyces sp. CB03238]|uniref:hypothetical protein n=1 Tax=Streptomyces sp. CB03238 TaxID=1907777 RepID=UPI0015C4B099|nr:hypothetical protein [Streptomyces sp. CB03238]